MFADTHIWFVCRLFLCSFYIQNNFFNERRIFMKEKFMSFKEKLTNDKKFKTQFISIATACVVVIALAIAIPVGIHNSKVETAPVESESSSQNNKFEISLTANAQAEITTEAQTEPETEAQTQATQPAPKPTQSVTKAQKPAQSAAKPAQSATKPAAKSSPNPNLTASEYQQLLDAGMPESLAKKSTAIVAKNAWKADIENVNDTQHGYCQICGKIQGHGTHGTCRRSSTGDATCSCCGTFIPKGTCHTCSY